MLASHSPVCLNCNAIMRCAKTGVYFVETYDDGTSPELVPYRVYSMDEYHCPLCDTAVMVGAGAPTYKPSPEVIAELAEKAEVYVEKQR